MNQLNNPSGLASIKPKTNTTKLPWKYSPESKLWNNTIAICASARDDNVTDVKEWLAYHRWLGVDHVILVENNSNHPIRGGLAQFEQAGFLSYSAANTTLPLPQVYKYCFDRFRTRYNFMAFLDVDEFIALRQPHLSQPRKLNALLKEFKGEAGLAVHMVRFGSNHRLFRPPAGGVLRDYTACQESPTSATRLIANTYFMADVATNPATAKFWDLRSPVNEARTALPYKPDTEEPVHMLSNPSANRIAVYHYETKSAHDYMKLIARGAGQEADFRTIDKLADSHGVICRELAAVAHMCCPRAA